MTSPSRPALADSRQGQDALRILEATSGTAPAPEDALPAMILSIGLPGSGKSTFARRLAPEIGAVVLESDALRSLLFEAPTFAPDESRRLFGALHAAARHLLETGHSVIIDATSLRASDRQPVYEIAAETGARLIQLSFSAPRHIIEQRLARRTEAPQAGDSSSAGLNVYHRLAETAEALPREAWSIDTSNAAETEAALGGVVEACRIEAGRELGGVR
jgi:predicted kinase